MSIWFLILNLATTLGSHLKWEMQAHFWYLNIKSFPTYKLKKIEHDYPMHFYPKSLELHNIPKVGVRLKSFGNVSFSLP